MNQPDHTEYLAAAGGEVRYYHTPEGWRYVCAQGEGSMLPSLEAAQAEVRRFAGPQICTHLGWGEYHGETSIYDGHSDPCFSGTEPEVIAYLEDLKSQCWKKWPGVNMERARLSWKGANGYWLDGAEAVEAIEGEISRFRGAEARFHAAIQAGSTEDEAYDAVYNAVDNA